MKLFKKKVKDATAKVVDGVISSGSGFRSLFGRSAELQGQKDVLRNASFSRNFRLQQEVCENIFIDSWLGKRIAEIPVSRAMKNGLLLEMENEKDEEKVWELYDKLQIDRLIRTAQVSADIYGSSMLLLKDKTQDAAKKAKEYKELEPVLVDFPFYSVSPSAEDTYVAGTVNFSNIGLSVDESFCAPFVGVPVIRRIAPDYKYYGMSVYQNIWSALVNDYTIMSAVANITYRSSIRHYKLKDLKQQVLAGRQDQVLDRMSLLDTSASIYGSVVMDSEDEMQIVSQSLSGLADIDKRSSERLSAATGIPATILLGKSPDGMSSTGKSDEKNMASYIEQYQAKMLPPIERIFRALISLAGVETETWKLTFKSPENIDVSDKPEYDAKILTNSSMMLNDLSLPEDVIRRYLLEHNLITQDEHDKIDLQVAEFDSLDDYDEEIDSTQNN